MLENVKLAYSKTMNIWYELDFRIIKEVPKVNKIIYNHNGILITITKVSKIEIADKQDIKDYHNYSYYEYYAKYYDESANYTENMIARVCIKNKHT